MGKGSFLGEFETLVLLALLRAGNEGYGMTVRQELEAILWPRPGGLVSLYCSSAYSRDEIGWHSLDEQWVWGALAFVFSRDALESFLADEDVKAHPGPHKVDVCVGKWAKKRALDIGVPCPSLAQHVGDISTLWPSSHARGLRRADHFIGDKTL